MFRSYLANHCMTGKNNAFAAYTNKQSFLGLQTY